MIGRVLKQGKRPYPLLRYLFGPGKRNEHVNAHLVAAWGHPAHLEPAIGDNGQPDVTRLAALLELPARLARGKVPDKPVWHCVVRAAPGDVDLGDGAWMTIAQEVMHRTGLSERGREDDGVRWAAVHHGDNHIHIVAVLARMDGRPVRLRGDWNRISEAMAWSEKTFGLTPVARAGPRGTAGRGPTRAENEKAARSGRRIPPRTELRHRVQSAAAAARTEAEFCTALAARGVQVKVRASKLRPGEVTGYAVSLPGDLAKHGRPVWFGGGKLAPDLTLPRLRARWATGPGRLTGYGMTGRTAHAVLAREALRAARAARSEAEFFDSLDQAGLLVSLMADPPQSCPHGYALSLPGLTGPDRRPEWLDGRHLDPRLALSSLRNRWQAGQAGAAPGNDLFTGASLGQVYAHAVTAARQAASDLTSGTPGRIDTAWAAHDLLTAAAEATGSQELRKAADSFARAARAPWSRVPVASPTGAMLRTAAYLLASCAPADRRAAVRRALIIALASLTRAVTTMRQAQLRNNSDRNLQAEAANHAATTLTSAGGSTWGTEPTEAAIATMARAPGPDQPRRSTRRLPRQR